MSEKTFPLLHQTLTLSPAFYLLKVYVLVCVYNYLPHRKSDKRNVKMLKIKTRSTENFVKSVQSLSDSL